ncbi:MAG: porphobilinogen synthase [Ignisphaera sp.]
MNPIYTSLRFPYTRPRRLRRREAIRDLVAQVSIDPRKLVLPIFINDSVSSPTPINALKGHKYYPPQSKELIELIQRALELDVHSFLLFGIPSFKDAVGSAAFSREGPIQKALRFIRSELNDEPILFADLCICSYTDHGHCGLIMNKNGSIVIDNDSTLDVYKKIAVSLAENGADFVAPSGMMDGQVRAIREALDSHGFTDIGIMSYSVKYASSFYTPFRLAMDSSPRFGDRRSYQMDFRNAEEAVKEAIIDVEEGADIIMVKPALMYLDVIYMLKKVLQYVPLAAYSVSGEYMMIELMIENGYLDRDRGLLEIATAVFRAGADIMITYHALDIAMILSR